MTVVTSNPILLGQLFPPFPPGDWNKGYVSKNAEKRHAVFTETETIRLPGVENNWCPETFNELHFTRQDRIRQGVHICIHPQINNGNPILTKLAIWPWEIASMEVETTAYQWLCNTGIGPKFLGHVTERKDG